MTRYSDPEFKVVLTPSEDILTASQSTGNVVDEGGFATDPVVGF